MSGTGFAVALLAAATAFSGCLGLDAGSGPRDARIPELSFLTPDAAGISLQACAIVRTDYTVPWLAVQDRAPPGFAPRGADALSTRFASWSISAASCLRGNETVSSASVTLLVSPPDEYWGGGFDAYAIVLSFVTPDEALAAQLAAWGLPARTGQVSVEVVQSSALERVSRFAASDGAGSIEGTALQVAPPAELREGLVRWFGVDAGEVTGVVDLTLGAGTGYDGNSPFTSGSFRTTGDGLSAPLPAGTGFAAHSDGRNMTLRAAPLEYNLGGEAVGSAGFDLAALLPRDGWA